MDAQYRGGGVQLNSMPCAACRKLHRRCNQDCVLAPYFPASQPEKFAQVHKVFGASNVIKMLLRSIVLIVAEFCRNTSIKFNEFTLLG
ncbi:hypothetical protein J5N97_019707 [Dioscorea zingiberensis]|uniref:LOB domain-containing protein n=1 Tax=Dioscorea zingiberensis TaxID=325984 RepID=A0A9D5HD46_9LILI|nr:hypothetical protein J5N97_019707 [Dioscorea zingiberensis]